MTWRIQLIQSIQVLQMPFSRNHNIKIRFIKKQKNLLIQTFYRFQVFQNNPTREKLNRN